MISYYDHALSFRGIGISPEETETLLFGMNTYTQMIRAGFGSNFLQTPEESQAIIEFLGHTERLLRAGKKYISEDLLCNLAKHCIGPVYHTYIEGETSTKETVARLAELEPETVDERIVKLGSFLLPTSEFEIALIDDGHSPGQPEA